MELKVIRLPLKLMESQFSCQQRVIVTIQTLAMRVPSVTTGVVHLMRSFRAELTTCSSVQTMGTAATTYATTVFLFVQYCAKNKNSIVEFCASNPT